MKTALVTGGSRGIGRGIALVLAEEGYDLVISYLSEREQAEEVARLIERDNGRRCFPIRADMADDAAPARLVKEAVERLGRLDLLVNNAGYTKFDPALGNDPAEVSRLMHVDFRAYYLAALAAAEHMAAGGIRGSVINITSSRAERAYPEDAVYGAMKAAIERAAESMALRFAPAGIRVNCVAPGATMVRDDPLFRRFYESLETKIPLGRVGTPEDIGHAVAWLASDRASYVTGVTLRVDGGLILPGMPERVGSDLNTGWGAHIDSLYPERSGT